MLIYSIRWRSVPFAFLLCFTGLASGDQYGSSSVLLAGSSVATIAGNLAPTIVNAPLMQLSANGGEIVMAGAIAPESFQAEGGGRQSHADGGYNNSSNFSLPDLSATLPSIDGQDSFADRVMNRMQSQAQGRLDKLLTPTGVVGAVQSGSSSTGLTGMLSNFGADMAQSLVDSAVSDVEQNIESFRLVRSFSVSWRPSYGIARESLFQADTVLSLYDSGSEAVIWQFGLQNRDGKTGANSGFAARTMLGNSWLLGANVFYDYLHSPQVDRWSAGLDLKSSWLGFSTNLYEGGKKSRPGDGFEYYSPDGWDIEVSGQVPQLPWLSLSANHYFWNGVGEDGVDLEGTNLELTAHPIPLLDLSLLYDIAQSGDNDFGMEVQLQYDFSKTIGQQFDYRHVQSFSDISQRRFDRVRREYEQRVQRRRLVTGLRIEDQTVSEADTTASLSIMLARAVSRDIEITATTSDGSATAGNDYTALAAVPVTIAAGQTSATVTVPLLVDTLVEGSESFTVTLAFTSTSIDVEFDRSTATVTISDDDMSGLSLSSVTVAEPAMGATATATIDIALSSALAQDLMISLSTVNGSATAGMDFVALANQVVTIAAGSTTANVAVTISPDEVVEAGETFTLVGTASAPNLTVGAAATVTITDSDMTELSIADQTVTEADEGTDRLTITLSNALSLPLDVTVTTGTDTDTATTDATAGDDYTALAAQTVTIPANTTSFQFPITIINDGITEGNEAFTVTIAATADRLTLGNSVATVTITDDDTANLGIADITVSESATQAGLTLTLSRPLGANLDVTVNTGTDSSAATVDATAGSDYTALTSSTVTITAGQTTAMVNIPILSDTIAEGPEVFTVVLTVVTMPAGFSIADGEATVTIMDDDTVILSLSTTSVDETGGTQQLTFSLAPTGVTLPANLAITVTDTGSGTAVAADYSLAGTTATITAGASSGTLAITLVNDAIVEGFETIVLGLAATAPNLTVTTPATVRIADDDGSTLQVRGAPLTTSEGDMLAVVVELTRALSTNFVATISSAAVTGGASSGTDYTALTETITFPAGTTEQTVMLATTEDMLVESAENLNLVLAAVDTDLPMGLAVDATPAVATITDDDAATLAISTASVDETAGTTQLMLSLTPNTVTLPTDLAIAIATIAGGTATAAATVGATPTGADDYALATAMASLTAGTTSTMLGISLNNDDVAEGTESIMLSLTATAAPTSLTITTPATVSINDDDGTTLRVQPASLMVAEDVGTATISIELTNPLSVQLQVMVTSADGTATAGSDYTALSGMVTFAPNSTTPQTLSLTITDDMLVESAETLQLILAPTTTPPGLTVDTPATLTIAASDAATLSLSTTSVDETGATQQLTFSLAPTGVTLPADLVITLTDTGNGTAVTADYTLAATTVTITAGASSATLDITLVDDTIAEGTETIELGLAATAPNLTVTSPGTVSITDDDSTTLRVRAGQSFAEDDATVDVIVELTGALSSNLELTVSSIGGGTATPGAGNDYTAITATTLTINAGDTMAMVALTIIDDNLVEAAETVQLMLVASTLPLPAGLVVEATGMVSINASDPATLSLSTTTVAENAGTTQLMLTLTPNTVVLPADLAITLATVGGTATAAMMGTTPTGADDYALAALMVTLTAGASTAMLNAIINNDIVVEGSETIMLSLAATADNLMVTSPATVTITDDDMSGLSIADLTVGEATAEAGLTLSLTNPLATPLVVTLNTASDTVTGTVDATAGADYTAQTAMMVTIPAGQTTVTHNIPILQDNIAEGPEVFMITATVATMPSGDFMIADGEAVVTITDDDTVILSLTTTEINEDGGGAQQDLTLSLAPTGVTLPADLAITLVATMSATAGATPGTVGSTPTGAEDFSLAAGTATITAGGTSTMVTVNLNDDDLGESTETFSLEITATAPNLTVTTPGTVSIKDDDSTTLRLAPNQAFDEDGTTTAVDVMLVLNRVLADDLEVTVSTTTAGGTATVGVDYTAIAATMVTIPAGMMMATVPLTITDDTVVEGVETIQFMIAATTSLIDFNVDTPGMVSINASDPATLSLSTTTVAENVGTTQLMLTLTPNTVVLPADLAITLATVGGTATATMPPGTTPTGAEDYALAATMVTLTAGASTAMLNAVINNDIVVEGPETIMLSLAATADNLMVTSPATVTITDDDMSRLSIADLTVGEATTQAGLTLSLTNPLPNPLVVTLNTATVTVAVAGTMNATAGADYTAQTAIMVTIPAGQTTFTRNIPILQDIIAEGPEVFMVTATVATMPSGDFMIADGEAVVTITDDDTGRLRLAPASATIAENAGATVQLTLELVDVTLPADLSITLAAAGSGTSPATAADTVGSTPTGEEDFSLAASTATITAGMASTTFTVNLNDDNIAEGTEEFELTITATATGLTVTSPATVMITDDDTATMTIRSTPALTVAEGGGTLAVMVELSNPLATPVAATISSANVTGGAVAGSDYTALSQMVTFVAGDTAEMVTLMITDDMLVESTETLNLSLTAVTNPLPPGLTVTTMPVVVSITDNDRSGLTLSPATVAEGAGAATFTLSLDNAALRLPANLDISVATMPGGTADAGAVGGTPGANQDYTLSVSTVTLLSTASSTTFTININDDTTAEGTENFMLALTAANVPSSLTITSPVTVMLTDNDMSTMTITTPAATPAALTVVEGASIPVMVTLSSPLSTEFVATISSANVTGGAEAGSDYTALSQTLTFAAGATTPTETVTLVTIEDALIEGNETLNLSLAATTTPVPPGLTVTTTPVVVTITDNDRGRLLLTQSSPPVSEDRSGTTAADNNMVTYTITIEPVGSTTAVFLPTPLMLSFSTADITATPPTNMFNAMAGSDYTAVTNMMVPIAAPADLANPGNSNPSATTTVTIMEDNIVEGTEQFMVTIAVPSGTTLPTGLELGTATVTTQIMDDDVGRWVLDMGSRVREADPGQPNQVLSVVARLMGRDDDIIGSAGNFVTARSSTVMVTVGHTADNVAARPARAGVMGDWRVLAPSTIRTRAVSLMRTTGLNQLINHDVSLTVAAGSSSASFGIEIINDNIVEGLLQTGTAQAQPSAALVTSLSGRTDEFFNVQLMSANHVGATDINSDAVPVAIEDDDTRSGTDGITTITMPERIFVNEGGVGKVCFNVEINPPISGTMVLRLGPAIRDGEGVTATIRGTMISATATAPNANGVPVAGSDYNAEGQTTNAVSFAILPDVASVETCIPYLRNGGGHALGIVADNIMEQDEIFFWQVRTISSESFGQGRDVLGAATIYGGLPHILSGIDPIAVTIRANDATGGTALTNVSISDVTVAENVGSATVSLRLSQNAGTAATFMVSTTDGTAMASSDYTALSATSVTVPAGMDRATFTIAIMDDAMPENLESFMVNIDAAMLPAGYSISDGSATVSITANDQSILTVSDATVVEGDGVRTPGISCTGCATARVRLQLSTALANDLVVTISHPTQMTGTGFADPSDYTFVNDGRGMNQNSTVTIPTGQTSAEAAITIYFDNVVEGNETFRVRVTIPAAPAIMVSASTAVAGSTNSGDATVTIIDDDVAALQFAQTAVTVAENAGTNQNHLRLQLGAVLQNSLEVSLIVAVASSGRLATDGVDFTSGTYMVTIPAMTQEFSFGLTEDTRLSPMLPRIILDDDIYEQHGVASTELFTVSIMPPTTNLVSVTANDVARVSITDNDRIVNVAVASDMAGTNPLAATGSIMLPQGSTMDHYLVADRGLAAISFGRVVVSDGGSDLFTVTTGASALFSRVEPDTAPFRLQHLFTLTPRTENDDIVQAAMTTVNIALATGIGNSLGTATDGIRFTQNFQSVTATSTLCGEILLSNCQVRAIPVVVPDDDVAALTVADASVNRTVGTNTDAMVNLTLSNMLSSPMVVTLNTRDGTAMAGSDYTALSNMMVTIPAMTMMFPVSITILGAGTSPTPETFTVDYSAALPAGFTTASVTGLSGTATVTITDPLILTVANVSVANNAGEVLVPFSLNRALPANTSLRARFTTAGRGSGETNVDYTVDNMNTTLIAAGESTGTFRIGIPASARVGRTFFLIYTELRFRINGEVSMMDDFMPGEVMITITDPT